MKIIIATDSFKGSLSALPVCLSIQKGIKNFWPKATTVALPLSDGGEGFCEILISHTKGRLEKTMVLDPLGRKVQAVLGIMSGGETAVIETASASGLSLLTKKELNPFKTTSFGTGQLIKAALDRGVKKIIVGCGGSATVDGGVGMAMALGIKFLDKSGKSIGLGGKAIETLNSIDYTDIDSRIKDVSVEIASDVDNPLLGPNGAARIYGPQKGATPAMVFVLEKNLTILADTLAKSVSQYVHTIPGGGSAGGLGAGLLAFTRGTLKSGIELMLDTTDFNTHLKNTDFVITGEGKIDNQTSCGKVPFGVANRAARYCCPVILIAGRIEEGFKISSSLPIQSLFSIINNRYSEKVLFAKTPALLEQCAEQIIRTIAMGATFEKSMKQP